MSIVQSIALGVGVCMLGALGTCFAGVVFNLDPHGVSGTIYHWLFGAIVTGSLCAFLVAVLS